MVMSLSGDYFCLNDMSICMYSKLSCLNSNWISFELIGMDWNVIKWFCIWMEMDHERNANVSSLK